MMNLKQRGDTVVEVMIVLAVLGSAISIAYATANRSLLNARQAQEASQANVLAQTQIDLLRIKSGQTDSTKTDDYIYVADGVEFCIDNTNPSTTKVVTIPSGPPDPTDPPSTCDRLKEASQDVWYKVRITHENAKNTFTVVIEWDDVLQQGTGTDRLTLNYRIHKPPPT